MPWWAWMATAVALLVIEVLIQTEFWLAVLGAAALGVALLAGVGLAGPIWSQWLIFAALSVILAVFVRRKLHERFVGSAPGLGPELVGEFGQAQDEIPPGGEGTVELRGSRWRAQNVGERPLEAGARARVEHVDGVVLRVRG